MVRLDRTICVNTMERVMVRPDHDGRGRANANADWYQIANCGAVSLRDLVITRAAGIVI